MGDGEQGEKRGRVWRSNDKGGGNGLWSMKGGEGMQLRGREGVGGMERKGGRGAYSLQQLPLLCLDLSARRHLRSKSLCCQQPPLLHI